MPALKLLNRHFLTQTKEDLLREMEGRKIKGSDVLFITPNGTVGKDVVLKGWVNKGREYYALGGGWHAICVRYGLQENTAVVVCSFRCEGRKLGIALVVV